MKTRNSSGDEIANVNFLYDDIVHALQNTIDSYMNSATEEEKCCQGMNLRSDLSISRKFVIAFTDALTYTYNVSDMPETTMQSIKKSSTQVNRKVNNQWTGPRK